MARLGNPRLHGTGPIEAFVIIEPELRQLFIEAERARDASAWVFCCIGLFGGAVCALLTFAPTEQSLATWLAHDKPVPYQRWRARRHHQRFVKGTRVSATNPTFR